MLFSGLYRCGLGVCTLENCLYAVGGWVGSEIGGTVEKYDPELHKWSVIAHCRSLKCWMGTTGDSGELLFRIYIINMLCSLYNLYLNVVNK